MTAILIPLAVSAIASAASMGIQRLIAGKQKQQPTDKGRNDDIRIFTSDNGSYIPWIRGTVRVAPNLIQASQIRQVITETTQTTGGKGGGQKTVTENYTYYTTLDMLVSQGPVDYIGKLWANTDIIYNFAPDPNSHYFEAEAGTLSGSATITSDAGCSGGHKVTGLGTGSNGKVTFAIPAAVAPTDNVTAQYTQLTIYYKSSTAKTLKVAMNGGTPTSYALPAVDSGNVGTYAITLSGFATSIELSNNGAVTVDVDRIQTWFSYLDSYPGDFPVTGITDPFIDYPIDKHNPYPFYNLQPQIDGSGGIDTYSFQTPSTSGGGIRVYTGSATQLVDSAIIADLDTRFGVGNGVNYASAHRGKCHIVLDNYQLPNGQMPNFTAEVTNGDGNLAGIVTDLYAEKNIDSSLLNVSALSSMYRTGLIVASMSSPAKVINDLEQWHGFKMIEFDGKINAVLDVTSPVFNITTADIRAREPSEQLSDSDCEITPVMPEENLAQQIIVNAMDPAIDYKNNAATGQVFASTLAQETVSLAFNFVASLAEMQQTADMLVIKQFNENYAYSKLETLEKFARYSPGDCGTLSLVNATHSIRIEQKQMPPLGGKVVFKALSVGEVDLNSASNTANPVTDTLSDVPQFPANTVLRIFESLPVQLTDVGLGVMIAACSQGKGKWQGCQVQNKLVSSEEWHNLVNVTKSTPIGVAQALLPDRAVPVAGVITGTVTLDGDFVEGDASIEVSTGSASAVSLKKGDYFQIVGDPNLYVVESDVSIGASNSGTIQIQSSPGLLQDAANGTAVNTTAGCEDIDSSVTVYFYEDVSFASSTSLILNGRATTNLLRWGDEWLQFRTATAASLSGVSNFKSAWTFTNLIRGCFGTSAAKSSHSSTDVVAGYDRMLFIALDSQYLNASVDFIAPSIGQTAGVAPNQTNLTITGLSTMTQPDTNDRTRGLGTPILCIAAAVTNTQAQISITGYTTLAKYRKIEYSANSDMSAATTIFQQASDFPNNQLPSSFTQTKSSDTLAVHKYFRVSHSAEGLIYGNTSDILDVTFATSGGTGGSSATCTGTVLPPPTLTSATFSTPHINLAFAADAGATGTIHILRQLGSGSFTEIGTVSHSTTTYADTITLDGAYTYKLTQDSISGESTTRSATASGISSGAGSPPSGLSASWDGTGTSSLAWTNNGATGTISIERKTNYTGIYTEIDTVSSSTTTYDDITAAVIGRGTTYFYQVRNASVSGYSNEVLVFAS